MPLSYENHPKIKRGCPFETASNEKESGLIFNRFNVLLPAGKIN
jgi:hypothetical protein